MFLRFSSHYPTLICLVIRWINFSPSWVSFANDSNCWVDLSHSLSQPRSLLLHFLPCQLKRSGFGGHQVWSTIVYSLFPSLWPFCATSPRNTHHCWSIPINEMGHFISNRILQAASLTELAGCHHELLLNSSPVTWCIIGRQQRKKTGRLCSLHHWFYCKKERQLGK